ncbi:S49 family peptidase [Terriglobus saanensis]|uniref:Peptidase S49 n=1 Tax=Terriglobus saanensis (strain ATCC BAA-1853 / DSM 23119 / SP1PR4) TaxID=401053 RepID=E8V540_TERSS|nr:S49 family peptidase [Terriglobus saanensis]ADV83727.1 peptidase S49 [Terriglobus saanensis SP1PR4]
MNADIHLEHRASSSQGKHEGEPSLGLCDRLNRTRDNSQRQLPTDHDYAVSTREYQTDQSSLKTAPTAARSVFGKGRKQRQRQKQTHRFGGVDTVTPYQAYFQTLVDNMHGQFIHDVATGRGTSDDKILPLATGQVWTGQQAIGLHLIDKQGGFRVALMDTARDAGISGEPGIQRPVKIKHGLLSNLISGDADNLFPNPSKLLDQAPGFYYMWK